MYPTLHIFNNILDTWGTCLFASLILVLFFVVLFRPKDFPLGRFKMFWLTILFFVFSIIGANLLNIIINSQKHFGQSFEEVFKTSGGAYLGAPLLALLFVFIFCISNKISFLRIADYIGPFLMLERVIGRIGCLGYGCCQGINSKLPWAYPFRGQMPQHPTQAYEMIYCLAIMISSIYLYKKAKNIKGVTFLFVIFLYSFFRFYNESLRVEGPYIQGNVKASHMALFILAVSAITGLVFIIKKSPDIKQLLKTLKTALLIFAASAAAFGGVILTVLSYIPKK